MRISEAAEISGLSADTIRFYEKEGLLAPIRRDAAGHRIFSPGDMDWLDLMSKLRTTGMAMADMKRFAALASEGDHTVPERYDILKRHRETMRERRSEIEACERVLDNKLGVYGPMKDAMEGKGT